MAERVFLMTGATDYWAQRLARRLAEAPGLNLIGLDDRSPAGPPTPPDYVQTDLRNARLVDLLRQEKVHTVCHLKILYTLQPRGATFDSNVRGTRNLLEACGKAGVRKVVVKSSMTVYGAHPDNAAFLTEAHALRASPRYGYAQHLAEIEKMVQEFRRRFPETAITTLRCASIVGPNADTPMTRFLQNRWSPMPLGFDPLLQLLHEDDAVEVLVHAALHHASGPFNIAADGPMPLSKIIAVSGTLRPALPPRLINRGLKVLGGFGLDVDRFAPLPPDHLRYSWVGDLTRMSAELGFTPRYSAEEALQEFAARQRRRPNALALASDKKRLEDTLARRREQHTHPTRGGNRE